MALILVGLSPTQAMWEHAQTGDLEKLKRVTSSISDVNWTNPDKNGNTALMAAMNNPNERTRLAVAQVRSQK